MSAMSRVLLLSTGLFVAPAIFASEPRLRLNLDWRVPAYSVAFSPDGNTLASGGGDDHIRLWDVATGNGVATLRGGDFEILTIHSVAFSVSGNVLVSVGYCPGTVKLWDLAKGKNTVTIDIHSSRTSVAFSPDGRVLASTGDDDDKLNLWDVATGENVGTFKGRAWFPVAFSPDGRTIASSGEGDEIALWDVASRKKSGSLTGHPHNIRALAFSPNGKTLGSATEMARNEVKFVEEIKLWDLAARKLTFTLHGSALAFSPDSKMLASGSRDRMVRLWDVASGRNIGTITGHTGPVYTVAFSPDGKTLASGSEDGTIKLWDVSALKQAGGGIRTPNPRFRRWQAGFPKVKDG